MRRRKRVWAALLAGICLWSGEVPVQAREVNLSTAYTGEEILAYAKEAYDDWGYEEVDTCTGFVSHVLYEDLKVPGGMEIAGPRRFVGYGKDPYNGYWTEYNPNEMIDEANKLVAQGRAILVYEGPVQGVYESEIPIRDGDIVMTTRAEMKAAYGHVALMENRLEEDGTIGWYGAHGPAPTEEQEVSYQAFGRTGKERKYDSPTGEDYPYYWQGMCHIYRYVDYAEPDIREDIESTREVTYALSVKKTDRATGKPVKDSTFIFENGRDTQKIKTDSQGMAEYTQTKEIEIDATKYRYITNYDRLAESKKKEIDEQGLYKSYEEALQAAEEAFTAQAEKGMPDYSGVKITDAATEWAYGLNNQHDNDKNYKVEIQARNQSQGKVSLKIVSLSEGAKCRIKTAAGDLVEEFITTDLGHGTIGYIARNLDKGAGYIIEQVQESYGYLKSPAVEITTEAENKTIYLEEKPIMGTLKVNVYGEKFQGFEKGSIKYKKEALTDTYITVFAKEDIKMGNKILYSKGQEVTTSKDTISNLPVGHYYFTIIQPAKGYTSDSKNYDFTIEASDTVADPVYEKDIQLSLQKQNISVKELMKEGRANAGSVVDIYHAESGKKIMTSGIDAQGYVEKLNGTALPAGNYYVEIDKEDRYDVSIQGKDGNIQSYVISLQAAGKKTTTAGSITLKLTDALDTDKVLEGTEYLLAEDELFETITARKTTDRKGMLIFENLPLGKYYLKQNSKTTDYTITTDTQVVELTKETPDLSLILSNIRSNVLIDSKDLGGMLNVEGLELELINSKGEVQDRWTTTKMTHFVTGLQEGETYKIIPLNSVKGYSKPSEIEFTMADGLNITIKSRQTADALGTLNTEESGTGTRVWLGIMIVASYLLAFMTKRPFSKDSIEALKWTWSNRK